MTCIPENECLAQPALRIFLYMQVKNVLDEILEKLPEEYNMADIMQKSAARTPYILVCFQECERMNILVREIWRSLKQLDLGLKVRVFTL